MSQPGLQGLDDGPRLFERAHRRRASSALRIQGRHQLRDPLAGLCGSSTVSHDNDGNFAILYEPVPLTAWLRALLPQARGIGAEAQCTAGSHLGIQGVGFS